MPAQPQPSDLIDIIKGALADDVRQYHAPEWIARAEAAIAGVVLPVADAAQVAAQMGIYGVQGDALSQQAGVPLHCTVPFEHAAQISTRKSYIAGFRAAEVQGRAAGIEEAAKLVEEMWGPPSDMIPAIRALNKQEPTA